MKDAKAMVVRCVCAHCGFANYFTLHATNFRCCKCGDSTYRIEGEEDEQEAERTRP